MNRGLRGNFKALARVAAVLTVGATLTACTTVTDSLDPTGWFGPDSPDVPASTGPAPDLNSIPAKPDAAATADDRQQVADSLGAARDNVQYSADELRGGTEAAAAPPSATQMADAAPIAPLTADGQGSDDNDAGVAAPSSAAPAATPVPAATPSGALAGGTEAAPAAPQPAQRPVAVAEVTPPAAGGKAPPAAIVPQGTEPAFALSKAPVLDPGISNYVPPSIISRYAANAPVAPQQLALAGQRVHLKAPPGTRRLKLGTGTSDVGGPEAMSGAVVANLGALPLSTAAAAYLSQGSASVRFAGAGTMLTREGREAVTAMAQAWTARGSQSYVHVTGYGGGVTASVGRLEAGFARAQARARRVADALIKAGVPADKVLVDAQGQAPAGEAGRADIVLE